MNRHGSAPEAVGLALGHVKTILFRPFDVGRWVMLGFIAFLANLGEGAFRFGSNFSNPWGNNEAIFDGMREGVSWMMAHALVTAIILFVLFVLILALVVLLMWLASRGTFVYIDCLATNRAQLVRPWKEHRELADSYFFWRLIFTLCSGFVSLLLAIPVIVSFVTILSSGEEIRPLRILFGTGILMVTVPLLIVLAFVNIFIHLTLREFVAPVQYLRRIRCSEAFRIVLGLMREAPVSFILYFLLKIVIAIVVGVGLFVLGCATCCVLFCCFGVPCIGELFAAILLLPLYVFIRSFPLFFLQGFGPEFDVFGPGAPGGGLRGPTPPLAPAAPSWASTPWPSAPPPAGGVGPPPAGTRPPHQGAQPPFATPPSPPRPESVPVSEWPEAPPVSPPLAEPETLPPPPPRRDEDPEDGPR